MPVRRWVALIGTAFCMTACASSAQFSGTVVTRNLSPGEVSLYAVRGLEHDVPAVAAMRPAEVKLALLGPMRVPDTLHVRWSYLANYRATGDPNFTESVLAVPLLPDGGGKSTDLLLTFTADKRWVAAWSPK